MHDGDISHDLNFYSIGEHPLLGEESFETAPAQMAII